MRRSSPRGFSWAGLQWRWDAHHPAEGGGERFFSYASTAVSPLGCSRSIICDVTPYSSCTDRRHSFANQPATTLADSSPAVYRTIIAIQTEEGRMKKCKAFVLGLLVAATGCTSPEAGEPTERPDVPPPATDPVPPLAGDDWAVTPTGTGSLRIGMTLAELAPFLEAGVDTAALDEHCDYVRAEAAPDSMLFMVEMGRLVRVDVIGGSAATAEGARVGDSESRILSLYPGATRGPHKYTDGAYLTVAGEAAGADSSSKLVFETDGERITRYRGGIAPAVDYVEGCS